MNKNIDIKNIKVAKRYALALAQSADKDIDEVFDNINSINDVIYENEQFRTFFLHPVVSLKDKKEAMRAAFDGKVNKISLNFVETLLDENRFSIFGTIFELFKKEVDIIKNKQRVEVKSAVEIKEETKARLIEKLSKKLNKDIVLDCNTDESIIGGLIIKIEDKVIDLSLKTKFETLKNI